MIRVCDHDHDAGDSAAPVCIVDGPFDAVDPVLVVQASTRTDTTDVRDAVVFVEFIGDLDAYSAGAARQILTDLTDETADVVVDLAGVSFCDSAGLRLIEDFHDRIVARGRRVSIHASSLAVLRLITLLDIERFDMCEPIISRRRSLRYDTTTSSAHRVRQWDEPDVDVDGDVDVPGDDRQLMRLVELPGGREHVNRRRFTIDVTSTSPHDSTWARRRRSALFIVNGELDAAAAISLDGCRCLDDFRDVTVDLSGVTLMTSAGLRLVMSAEQQVRARDGRFAVTDPSPIVQRLLDILGISFEQSAPAPNARNPNTARSSARSISTHRHARSTSAVRSRSGSARSTSSSPR